MQVYALGGPPEVEDLPEGSWTARCGVYTNLYPQLGDDRLPNFERPLVREVRKVARVLGISDDDATCYVFSGNEVMPGHKAECSGFYTVVSSKPFAIVRYVLGSSSKPRRCEFSRQIHHGRLGQCPDTHTDLRIHPSTIADPRDGGRMVNWVSVRELARVAGVTSEDVFRGFGDFSPSSWCRPNVPMLSVLPTGALQRDACRVYTRDSSLPEGFCKGETEWFGNRVELLQDLNVQRLGDMYVPQSFAYRVIRLRQFGYQPDGTMPGPGFLLEATTPARPPHALPILQGDSQTLTKRD